MDQRQEYINSVNLNTHTDFPYLVLNIENGASFPLNPGFRVMHWHEDLQFIYVLEGVVRIKTLDQEEILSAREGVFINKNVVHLVEGMDACKYKSFLFPELFLEFYLGSPAAGLTKTVTEESGISLVLLHDQIPWQASILRLLRELVELEHHKDALYPYEVLTRLTGLWLLMLKNAATEDHSENKTAIIRTRQCLQYVQNHYREEISLEQLAKSASISKSECLRCFKETLQTTPYRYLMDYRLSVAAKLLRETEQPVNEIAMNCGFGQQSHFGKCFREKMGCTPSKYRAENKI